MGAGQTPLDRAATFTLKDGVALLGGFDGTETTIGERAGLFEQTVLTGDLLGDDGPNLTNRADNSRHVVTAGGTSSKARLDGFTIRGGYADIEGGGGLYSVGGSQHVERCFFVDNAAVHVGFFKGIATGGAVYQQIGSPTFVACEFNGNQVQAGTTGGSQGGAVYNGNTAASYADCVFRDNVSAGSFLGASGGAVYNGFGNPSFTRCRFERNRVEGAAPQGGALYFETSPVRVLDCEFVDNQAGPGGGSATGGAIAARSSTGFVRRGRFVGNQAIGGGTSTGGFLGAGGAIHTFSSPLTVSQSMFSGNRALGGTAVFGSGPGGDAQGGAWFHSFGTASLTQSTLFHNLAVPGAGTPDGGSDGGGVIVDAGGMTVVNSILWSNADASGSGQTAQLSGAAFAVDHSCVMGWDGALGGSGNTSARARSSSTGTAPTTSPAPTTTTCVCARRHPASTPATATRCRPIRSTSTETAT